MEDSTMGGVMRAAWTKAAADSASVMPASTPAPEADEHDEQGQRTNVSGQQRGATKARPHESGSDERAK